MLSEERAIDGPFTYQVGFLNPTPHLSTAHESVELKLCKINWKDQVMKRL